MERFVSPYIPMPLRAVKGKNYILYRVENRENFFNTIRECYRMMDRRNYEINIIYDEDLFLVPQVESNINWSFDDFICAIRETLYWYRIYGKTFTIQLTFK